MTRKLATLLIVGSLGLFTALPSRAGDITLVSNLSATFLLYGTVQAEDAVNSLPGFTIAQEFTSGVATTLTLIQAELGGLDTGSLGDFQLHADLYADNGGLPTWTPPGLVRSSSQGDISTGTDISDAKVIDFTPDQHGRPGNRSRFSTGSSCPPPPGGDGGGVNWFQSADDFTQVGSGDLPSYTVQGPGSQGWDLFRERAG